MAIVISILLFSALMGAITVYGYRRYARPDASSSAWAAPSWRRRYLALAR